LGTSTKFISFRVRTHNGADQGEKKRVQKERTEKDVEEEIRRKGKGEEFFSSPNL
jgi:hypothetical protein